MLICFKTAKSQDTGMDRLGRLPSVQQPRCHTDQPCHINQNTFTAEKSEAVLLLMGGASTCETIFMKVTVLLSSARAKQNNCVQKLARFSELPVVRRTSIATNLEENKYRICTGIFFRK